MKSFIKFCRDNAIFIKEYIGLQIWAFVFAKIVLFKDAYIEPLHKIVYGAWFFIA